MNIQKGLERGLSALTISILQGTEDGTETLDHQGMIPFMSVTLSTHAVPITHEALKWHETSQVIINIVHKFSIG